MQDISAIPMFLAVTECHSFSKAADKLGITKSAVSKRISGLEQHLGVKLFYRSTRQLSLTEAGERYAHYAAQAWEAAKKAENAAIRMQDIPQGELKINAPSAFARLYLAPIMPTFLRQYPHVSVHLNMNEQYSNIIEQGVDVALRAGELPDSSLVAKKLLILTSVLCAAPEYLDQYGVPQEPSALVNHNCLLSTHHSASNEWVFTQQSEAQHVHIQGNYQVNNGEALYEAALQGIGIARLPMFIAQKAIIQGRLTPLLTEYKMPHKDLYALFPERKLMPEKVRVFIDFIVAKLAPLTC